MVILLRLSRPIWEWSRAPVKLTTHHKFCLEWKCDLGWGQQLELELKCLDHVVVDVKHISLSCELSLQYFFSLKCWVQRGKSGKKMFSRFCSRAPAVYSAYYKNITFFYCILARLPQSHRNGGWECLSCFMLLTQRVGLKQNNTFHLHAWASTSALGLLPWVK